VAYGNAGQKLGFEGKNINEIHTELTEKKNKIEIHQQG
jgi:hypothetical protein